MERAALDKVLETEAERVAMPEGAARDDFIRAHAKTFPAGSWILDVGAGASKYRPFFKHCRYETQDFCQYEGPVVKYVEPITYVCDAASIPLPTSSLDGIVCTEVFEHLVDPMAALREFARLLKPGGKLLLTSPSMAYIHMEPYHYYAGFTRFWHAHWLPKCGFKLVSIESCGGPARAVVVFLQAFLNEWRSLEATCSTPKKITSKLLRVPIHRLATGVLPRWLQPLDKRLGYDRICFNHLVAAERLADPEAGSAAGGVQK